VYKHKKLSEVQSQNLKNTTYLVGSYVRSCYSYGGDKKWTKLADLTTTREGSASVPIPGGVWVTGGYDGRNNLKTTEIIFLNKTKKVGEQLSAPNGFHCLVKYGDKIFSTGGGGDEIGGATSNVWQFDSEDNFAKVKGPEMKKTRENHACGIVHSVYHGFRPLLVVAGAGDGGQPGSTGGQNSEYWDFTLPGSTWQLCSKSCSLFLIHHYL
jgi:N-acetylneuraminic acid mutarotase